MGPRAPAPVPVARPAPGVHGFDAHARLKANSAWFLGASGVATLLLALRGVVLARLLVPADFGVYDIVATLTGLAVFFGDIGAGVFLLYRRPEDLEHWAPPAFWLNLLVSSTIAGAIALASPMVASAYGVPLLEPILIVMAAARWLTSVTVVHEHLLLKSGRYRPVALGSIVISTTAFLGGLALAGLGYGVWAFVLPVLLGHAVYALVLAHATGWWMPRWSLAAGAVRELLRFGGTFVLAAAAWFAAVNAADLLLGKFAGVGDLGLYSLAFGYALFPATVTYAALSSVIFPELGNLYRRQPVFWETFHGASRILAFLTCGAGALLIATAPDSFPLVFGAAWLPAVLPFQVLVLYGMVRGLWVDPLRALARFDLSLRIGAAAAVLMGVLTYATLAQAPAGWALVAVAVLLLVVVGGAHVASFVLVDRTHAVRSLREAAPYMAVALAAVVLAFVERSLLVDGLGQQPHLLLPLQVLTVAGVYGGFHRSQIARVLELMRRSVRAARADGAVASAPPSGD